jgi:transposase
MAPAPNEFPDVRLKYRALAVPQNITLLALPPRSPDLNPVENIWQYIRENWLSNRVFESYDDIVTLACEAWNRLMDRPSRIMTIGLREWAHGF